MCLIVHSEGHLTIKVLYEQIYPSIIDGRLDIVECYDVVLRSHSPQPMDKLYILSPHGVRGDGNVFEHQEPHATQWFDAVLQPHQPIRDAADRFQIGFLFPLDEPPLVFDVTRLYPSLSEPQWIVDARSRGDDALLTPFRSIGMTMCEVRFRDGVLIEPYDAQRTAATTYWLRLVLRPDIHHLTDSPIRFGREGADPSIHYQPCMVLSPDQVLSELSTQLTFLGSAQQFRNSAPRTEEEVFGKIFSKESTSTRIEDHRISLLSDGQTLVLNTSVDGDCAFLEVATSSLVEPIQLMRTWFAGARHYSFSDPLTLTRDVYGYLKLYAQNRDSAKTKEAISSALSCQRHENVAHVVDCLVEWTLLETPKDGLYCIHEEPLRDGSMFLKSVKGADEIDLRHRTEEFLHDLYGTVTVTGPRAYMSRFRFKGFRLFFDLAFWN